MSVRSYYLFNPSVIPDGSITTAKTAPLAINNSHVATAAAIAESKLNLASDAAAGTASRRTIGTGALQSAAGNDSRFTKTNFNVKTIPVSGAPAVNSNWPEGGFLIRINAGQTWTLVAVRSLASSGSATYKLQRRTNAGGTWVDITGFTALDVSTTESEDASGSVAMGDLDRLRVAITALGGTPVTSPSIDVVFQEVLS